MALWHATLLGARPLSQSEASMEWNWPIRGRELTRKTLRPKRQTIIKFRRRGKSIIEARGKVSVDQEDFRVRSETERQVQSGVGESVRLVRRPSLYSVSRPFIARDRIEERGKLGIKSPSIEHDWRQGIVKISSDQCHLRSGRSGAAHQPFRGQSGGVWPMRGPGLTLVTQALPSQIVSSVSPDPASVWDRSQNYNLLRIKTKALVSRAIGRDSLGLTTACAWCSSCKVKFYFYLVPIEKIFYAGSGATHQLCYWSNN